VVKLNYSWTKYFTTIRQLEFAILQHTQQSDELTNAVQHVIAGKLPLRLLNPFTLHGILEDITPPSRQLRNYYRNKT
jgi:hypothetical protein